MRIIPFTIPVSGKQSLILQEDQETHFYPHLHQHPEVQITWVRQGTGNLLVGEQVHRFQAGAVFVIGANQPHLFNSDPAYFEPNSALKVHALTLFFHPLNLSNNLKGIPELTDLPHIFQGLAGGLRLSEATGPRVMALLQQLQAGTKVKRMALFLELIDQIQEDKTALPLSQAGIGTISEQEGQRMSTIFQYVLQHYAEDISLEQMAALVHLSSPAFCRYFKKHTRKTFTHFLNEIRIHAACRILLEEERKTIAAIALSTGFNNIPHFNRTFKQLMGERPTDWKKSRFR